MYSSICKHDTHIMKLRGCIIHHLFECGCCKCGFFIRDHYGACDVFCKCSPCFIHLNETCRCISVFYHECKGLIWPSYLLTQSFHCVIICCIHCCLLYTSDAADEEDSVDLGG